LEGKPEENSTSRRPRYRWENKIKMDLKQMGWECEDWIYQDKSLRCSLVDMVEPLGSTEYWEFLD
jgi:hypothetical protein